ncbi:DUF5060 domain-containing protein [Steroidobacter cummioxidans]|uniref:DUF5060 domain-containing protein n=1 Tax=Steroidobacter cummioxidans TaxID=1803913 RepID=UPI00137947BC|nr:DUF5060 domain-containing protein [Steroidobacter cummioxidans]
MSTDVFEATFSSNKEYADPFNDIDVDVIFSGNGRTWRVPTFWRGGNSWGVRFSAPLAGSYSFRLESTDRSNPDLNGHKGQMVLTGYSGTNTLLKRGPLKVSANKRYLQHADGTPFYWLGEGLYTALSDRIGWDDFQKLTLDRRAKGFTVAEVAAGLTVSNEERAPIDPGFRNEGGPVWDPDFKRINPQYFDYADRRIRFLVDSQIVPAIIGAWGTEIKVMGVAKMQKHWRYLIARYGAYPVIWILGGEISDPPINRSSEEKSLPSSAGWWTQVARYVREIDPYKHPLTAHEGVIPHDVALQEESLTSFDLTQPSHFGWSAIGIQIAQLNTRSSSTRLKKPIVVGEIGYEGMGGTHLQDFQRTAFWTAMLNGAAGYSYGTSEIAMATSLDKPLHRTRYSFYTWEEAMNFPGSYQVGIGAKLLMKYPWWQIEPHPEWIIPRGTTLLEPHEGRHDMDLGPPEPFLARDSAETSLPIAEWDYPKGEWKRKGGNFLLPYAAGIPRKLRITYIPYYGLLNFVSTRPPTILGLEDGVTYHAYYWEPSLGIKFDLGTVAKPGPGHLIRKDKFSKTSSDAWLATELSSARFDGQLIVEGRSAFLLKDVNETDLVASVDVHTDSDAALLLRYQNPDNYVAAVYSPIERAIYIAERKNGRDGPPRPRTQIKTTAPTVRLMAEIRDTVVAASVFDGDQTYSTAIETVSMIDSGAVGLMHEAPATTQSFSNFELRRSPTLVKDERLERKIYDARGIYRGELAGPGIPDVPQDWPVGWDDFGKRKYILLSAYRPDRPPVSGDLVLVLENRAELGNER